MSITFQQAAALVDGVPYGGEGLVLQGAGTLSSARKDEITFVESKRALDRLVHCAASAVILPAELRTDDRPYIHVANVREAFLRLVTHFRPPRKFSRIGVSPQAQISSTARLAHDVDVHAGAVIGEEVEIGAGTTIHANVVLMAGCRIGENCTIFPGAVLYEDTIVGPRCLIHANAVIGAYGFGYDAVGGTHRRGPQLGYVELEADVEIGAVTTVDRGTYGATTIGTGTKIDNQVMIAHNCRIGRHNLICSQVGVAGSSSTGDYVVMAGQVGVPDHVHIGDQVVLGAKSGVMRDVPNGLTMLGIPATPERDQMQKQAAFARLPEMRKQLRQLQRVVDQFLGGGANRADGSSVGREEAA